MQRKSKVILGLIVTIWLVSLLAWYLHRANFAILNPQGVVAVQERHLMMVTFLLAMVVIIPVYIMTFSIAWRYREGNKQANYQPDFSNHLVAELVWWGIPAAIILTLSIITWNTSHSLDPHRELASNKPPLTIQVVALDWKWLFIYPQQQIASVNFVQFPVDRPVDFTITADAPMNSFWIPQLGSQIYAMPGMSSPLKLMATKAGDYAGSSANISGKGFSGMRFTARASSESDFTKWANFARQQPSELTLSSYNQLAQPSENNPQTVYGTIDGNLYNHVMLKYMAPEQQ